MNGGGSRRCLIDMASEIPHNNNRLDIGDIPLNNKRTLKELLVFNGTSYWWYIDDEVISTDTITDLRKKRDKIFAFISSHCHIILLIYDIIMKLLYFLSQLQYVNNGEQNNKNKATLFIHTYHHRWIHSIDKLSGNLILKNIFYDDIIKELPDDLVVIPIYDYTYNPLAFFKFKEILATYDSLAIPLNNYLSPSTWKLEVEAQKHFNKIYLNLKNDTIWLSKVALQLEITITQLKQRLQYQLLFVIPLCVKYNSLFDKLLDNEKPSLLFLVSEQTPHGRGWIECGKKHEIQTVALQHGRIDKFDFAYNQNEIIPDLTLVWSEYECDILRNILHYSKEQVKVVGNPRFDTLYHAYEQYSKDGFIKHHGLNPNHRFILWATGFHANNITDNINYIDEIFSSVDQITNVTLIIKPHPMDGREYSNLIETYINKYRISVLLMSRDSNTTELVLISDLVIMKSSTVGDEAVILHKPLIELNLSCDNASNTLVNEGVAIGVSNNGDLKEVIERILSSKSSITKEQQDQYIRYHLYDGNASKRVANIILEYLKHKSTQTYNK